MLQSLLLGRPRPFAIGDPLRGALPHMQFTSRTPGRRARVACAIFALTTLAAVAAAAAPVPPQFFGVCPVTPSNYPPLPMGTLGHGGFAWPVIEPTRGTFDFTHYDAYVDSAVAHGLIDSGTNTVHMTMTLGLTPEWALADTTSCTHSVVNGAKQCTSPPDNIDDWRQFIVALKNHYDGVAHPHIEFYELWNEADDTNWYTPKPKGSYTQMVQLAQVADSVLQLDGRSKLLTPSVTSQLDKMTAWMIGYLKAGGAQYADGGAYHGYLGANGVKPFPMPEDTTYSSVPQRILAMRAVFDTCGLLGKPMYQTEGSWGNFNVTDPDTMAAWLARFELLQAGLSDAADLRLAAWFCWADSTFGWGNLETGTGDPDKAAYAYDQVYDWVVGATVVAPCSESPNGTWTCEFTRPGGYDARAVWNVNGATPYTPGNGFTRYRTIAGDTVAIAAGGTISVGLKPKLVENGNALLAVPDAGPRAGAFFAAPSVTRGPTRFALGRAAGAATRVTVRDVRGRLVRTLTPGVGATSVDWDGRDARGMPLAMGVYFARIEGALTGAIARVTLVR